MARRETDGVIVVGVDGSESSRSALRWAARHAALTGAELRPVQAWQPPLGYGMPVDYSGIDFAQQTRRSLDQSVEEALGTHPGVPVRPQAVEGHPAAVLVEASRDADLLVVGSHGRGAFAGMLLGSVSGHCVHHASCPVLVVRPDHR
ncbi:MULTISPECIES: universal stress protein [unclassified Streptomyces]|uniref:universal stress protein n=1 Tax=unclassified Streptomyces TaxID=2593676 RepID=UPI0022B65A00|nr:MULTISPECIES: universal stress protein [unclassified Streptomyces]MCZ7415260.1 universal stress protein [Streptomyces sp. WMMC897]MCZ7432203.1 universal stress protein [Streptomyces sp. WMMC1477]